MNFRTLLIPVMMLAVFSSCGYKITYHELPNNRLSFPAEGGSIEYAYPNGLQLGGIYINGEIQTDEHLYIDGVFAGYQTQWVQYIENWRIGRKGIYTIKTLPNPSPEPRKAEIRCDLGKVYGVLFIWQDGRKPE